MDHGSDVSGKSSRTAAGQCSVNSLAKAPNGELHLLVTFQILTSDQPGEGGDGKPSDMFTVSCADGELVEERDLSDERDGLEGSGSPYVLESEPFVGSVMRPEMSDPDCTDTAFGEAVDVESLVTYLGMDFVEHELFVDRFLSESDDVVYTSRGVGTYQLLCVYSADRGLLVVVDEGEAIQPLVDHARSLLTKA